MTIKLLSCMRKTSESSSIVKEKHTAFLKKGNTECKLTTIDKLFPAYIGSTNIDR